MYGPVYIVNYTVSLPYALIKQTLLSWIFG